MLLLSKSFVQNSLLNTYSRQILSHMQVSERKNSIGALFIRQADAFAFDIFYTTQWVLCWKTWRLEDPEFTWGHYTDIHFALWKTGHRCYAPHFLLRSSWWEVHFPSFIWIQLSHGLTESRVPSKMSSNYWLPWKFGGSCPSQCCFSRAGLCFAELGEEVEISSDARLITCCRAKAGPLTNFFSFPR